MEVYKTFAVEAARSLPHLPDDHPCKRIHGHSFKITITVNGQINEDTGFVMDFSEIDSVFSPIHEMIDHAYLNEIKGLENPSSENLCHWIWSKFYFNKNHFCFIRALIYTLVKTYFKVNFILFKISLILNNFFILQIVD